MGNRCNITVQTSHAELADDQTDEPFWLRDVNAWLAQQDFLGLVQLDTLTDRNMTVYLCSGASRGLTAPIGFVEFILAYPWEAPAQVLAVIQPERGNSVIIRPPIAGF